MDSSKSKNLFLKIGSKYIIQRILDNLKKKASLEILKINKTLRERLKLSVNDYKIFSETYSPIEIEIIPEKNKYGEFIKIENEEDEKYYHIYFNNNKEEIKKIDINNKDKADIIKIKIDYQVKSFSKLFNNIKCIVLII